MTSPEPRPAERPGGSRPTTGRMGSSSAGLGLRPAPYWAGVLATAAVSGLIAVLGVLVAQDVLDLHLLTPSWVFGGSDVMRFAVLGASAAIFAGALLQLLFIAAPTPVRFFTWILLLLTAAAAVLPFSLKGGTGDQVATAVINVLVGVGIVTLLSGVAARCVGPRDGAGPDWPGEGRNPVNIVR
jgi:Family of unknown function (DUF6069)